MIRTDALHNMAERRFNKLTNARGLATGYEKAADSYLVFIHLVSIRLYLSDFPPDRAVVPTRW